MAIALPRGYEIKCDDCEREWDGDPFDRDTDENDVIAAVESEGWKADDISLCDEYYCLCPDCVGKHTCSQCGHVDFLEEINVDNPCICGCETSEEATNDGEGTEP